MSAVFDFLGGVFDAINSGIGTVLGYVMWACFQLLKDYGLAIILFTLFTKVILLPLALWVQKNSIKMVKMTPELNALKHQFGEDKDGYMDAQMALYKKEKYSPMASVWPLVLQLPLIFGLIDVIYKPLKHLLHLPTQAIDAFVQKAAALSGTTVEALGSAPQLKVVELVQSGKAAEFASLQLPGIDVAQMVEEIQGVNTHFLWWNLSEIPSLAFNLLLLIPIFAGLSALIMCVVQNRINVLQLEQNNFQKWGMTLFMIAFSSYFAFLVPTGVGLYWIFGNLFAILSMYAVNWIMNPRKYIDYKVMEKLREANAKAAAEKKVNSKRGKADYKRFCQNMSEIKLVFYSEGSGYYKYFQNIIEAVLNYSDVTIHYITSDPNDAIFNLNNPQLVPYFVDETRLIPLLMKLEADIVVMTSPDLEKYHIKRSKVRRDVEYIYLDHACSTLNMGYRPGALDAFDTIFAVSELQGKECRAIEKLRGTKKKRIIKCGYGLIDNMIASYEALPPQTDPDAKKTILIAPSWQYDNILDSCLDPLLDSLLDKNFRVIVRPHPQYIKRFPMNMSAIMEKYGPRMNEDFEIQTDFSSNSTVYTADLLITDWSAIGFEYSFTTCKPTLYINTKMKVVNKDWDQIDIKPYDIYARDIIGKSINKEDVQNADAICSDFIARQGEWAAQIKAEREAYFYNLGFSGEVGAEYLVRRITGKKVPMPHLPQADATAKDA